MLNDARTGKSQNQNRKEEDAISKWYSRFKKGCASLEHDVRLDR